jgi:long-chain acyl-CoA synthetase
MEEFGLRLFAAREPGAVAIVDGAGRAWTRGVLSDLIDRTAGGFVAADLGSGDVVAIVAPNCAELLAVHLAGIAAGLYVVPINWHLTEREIAYVLADCGAKAVIAHERLGRARLASLAAMCGAATLKVAIGAAPGFLSLEELGAAPLRSGARERGRLLPYTSATTGRPKAVRLPLGGARAALAKTVAWHRSLGIALEADNVHLCQSMLYYAAPLERAVIALEMGHTVVLMDGWDAAAVLRVIEERRVTTTFMVPTMFVRLLKLPEPLRAAHLPASLRCVVHSGAPCPLDVKRRMLEWWGPIIFETYGASEVQGTIASPAEWLAHPGTVGKPIPGTRLAILDGEGRELPRGEIGSVYLTPHTGERFEYLGNAAQTAACRRGDLVTVGDRGFVDGDGFLYLVGRESELIICSGMNVYPAEIEHALLAHPAVLDCAVTGEPHEVCGEVPVAHVALAPGVRPSAELTATLLTFAGERLAAMKLPRRIAYQAALPRDANGKLRRGLLRLSASGPGIPLDAAR